MKRIIIILASILMSLAFGSLNATSDEGVVVVTILPASHVGTTVPNRSLPPIEAYYSSCISSVIVSFTNNIGDVDVVLTNLFTGESYEGSINAYGMPVLIPISGTEGVYTINFTLENGDEYIGEFEL